MNIIPLNDAMLATIKLALIGTPIQGPTGRSAYEEAVANGFVGTAAQWLNSLNGTNGVDGQDGADGADGREVNLRMTATHLQWRLGTGGWIDLYPLSNLYVELRKTTTHIQWRLGLGNWADLVPLSDIVGPKGYDGWTMIPAMVPDGERRVIQVVDWIGGQGVKPATGQYIGPNGLVLVASAATDLRGSSGPGGGDMLTTQNLNDLADKAAARNNLGVYSVAAADQLFAEMELQIDAKQANLGFVPVEQGGGTDQVAGKVQIGRTAANKLKAQVAGTDYGFFVFEAQLNAALNQKLNSSAYSWNTLPDKPLTFNPSAHNHPISGVDGLQSALDGKVPWASVSTAATGSSVVQRDAGGNGSFNGLSVANLSVNTGLIYADGNSTIVKTGVVGSEKYWKFDSNGYLYCLSGGIHALDITTMNNIQAGYDSNNRSLLTPGSIEVIRTAGPYIDLSLAFTDDFKARFQYQNDGYFVITSNGGKFVVSTVGTGEFHSANGSQAGDILTRHGTEQIIEKQLTFLSYQNPQDTSPAAMLEVHGQGAGYGAWMKFHRPSQYGTYFGMFAEGRFGYGGGSVGPTIYEFWDNRNLPRPATYANDLGKLSFRGNGGRLEFDYGSGWNSILALRGSDEQFRDITATRGDGSGAIFFGGGGYLYHNTAGEYEFGGSAKPVRIPGNLYVNENQRIINGVQQPKITVSSSEPGGTRYAGDLWIW